MRKFKKFAAVMLVIIMLLVTLGCANSKTIDGVTYDTYGLLNKDEKQNPNIQYELVWGNIFWGAVLVESIFAPIYFFGFSMWEPTGKKTGVKGQITEDRRGV